MSTTQLATSTCRHCQEPIFWDPQTESWRENLHTGRLRSVCITLLDPSNINHEPSPDLVGSLEQIINCIRGDAELREELEHFLAANPSSDTAVWDQMLAELVEKLQPDLDVAPSN